MESWLDVIALVRVVLAVFRIPFGIAPVGFGFATAHSRVAAIAITSLVAELVFDFTFHVLISFATFVSS